MNNRINLISEEDKLWELYLHTLAGYHANVGTNRYPDGKLERGALIALKDALKVWNTRND